MGEALRALGPGQQEPVDASAEVVRYFQLVLHPVAGDFSPDGRLAPVYPGAAHFVRVSLDVGGPRAAADAVPGLEEKHLEAWAGFCC